MFKDVKIKFLIVIILSTALTVLIFSGSIVAGQEDPFYEIKDKLTRISEKERNTIQELFIHAQKIEEMEIQEKRISSDMETLRNQISDLQKTIKDEEIDYTKKKEMLRRVLSSYQRLGPGSNLEILLEADSLPDLLLRINTLRDLTHNTEALLEEIQKNKEKQSKEKTILSEKLTLVEENRKQLGQALVKNRQLRADMETYLVSLSSEKEQYQEYLEKIQKTWRELKPIFSKAINEFSAIIEKGSFPQDALKISFDSFSFKVSIDEQALNDIIKMNPQLTEMAFELHQGLVKLSVPEKSLMLEGKFVIVDDYSLKFDIEKGSFLGLPLETSTIKVLSQDNYLVLNFKSQLFGFKINSVEIKDGYLNFSIKPE